ncbi:NAD(P)H-dependent oxidoreductase [Clostridium botulinum]|nr:NAD(P)H-dependent oxidoreductase [Clostridium botulinum]
MKTIILYYSYGGNTKRIAEMIQHEIGGDLAEIETVKPYTDDYNSVVDQGQREVNSGFMPEIKSLQVDMSDYDCIILGTPVWWYTFAPAVRTFLTKNNLEGKVVYPFATNGGWIGHTFKDFEKACKGAEVCQGLNIKFNGDKLETEEAAITSWVGQIKL